VKVASQFWDCAEHGHLLEAGSYDCIACGEPCQLTFADVVDSEPIEGDAEFTQWLKAQRPQIDTAVAVVKHRDHQAVIEDVLPGL
jgi:hypothetical protein